MTFRAGLLPGLMNQPTAQIIDGSLKFNDDSSNYLSRTFASGNRNTWTWSGWVKRTLITQNNTPLMSITNGENDNDYLVIRFAPSSTPDALCMSSYGTNFRVTDAFFRDIGWYHFVVACDTTQSSNSDRFKVYVNGVLQTFGTESTITQNTNLGFNQAAEHRIGRVDSSYFDGFMSQVYFIDGLQLGPEYFGFTDPLTNTWRPKKFKAEGTTYNDGTVWSSGSTVTGGSISNAADGFDGSLGSGGYAELTATDTSTTANVKFAVNFKNVTKVEVFVHSASGSGDTRGTCETPNGVTFTSATLTGSSQSFHTIYEGEPITLKNIGWGINQNGATGTGSDGFRAFRINGEILIDSTTRNLDFGTNGFYLPMDNQDDFEKDKSGKGNNWTKNGFSGTFIDPDVLKDSPSGAVSGGRGQTGITTTSSAPANYCILNPLDTIVSLIDGNLETSNSSGWQSTRATTGMKSGKFYWETQNNQTAAAILGISREDAPMTDGLIFGSDANPAWAWAGANSYFNSTSAGTSLSNHVTSDTVQYAFDADNGRLWFGRNGTWYNSSWGTTGNPATSDNPTVSGLDTTKRYFACASFFNGSAKFNFGQKPFKYAPPQGFLPINSASATPETVVPRSDQYVGVTTYTGTSANPARITSENNFTPDFVWVKSTSNSESHALYDTVRGATYRLKSDSTDAQNTGGNELQSFIPGGFTTGNNGHIYYNGYKYAAWMWKAGGNKNTFNVDDVGYASAAAAGITGLDGTGEMTTAKFLGCSIGTKQGFSIIKYRGLGGGDVKVPHGLSQTPGMVIVKNIDSSVDWAITHSGLPGNRSLRFTTANNTSSGFLGLNKGGLASTYFTINYSDTNLKYVNASNEDYIAYIWHNISGLQKFGSYVGNENADGPFVELGFRPSIVLLKNATGSTNNWMIIDSERGKINVIDELLFASSDGTENTGTARLDFLSNGFKVRDSSGGFNEDDQTFVYAAWAEAPSIDLFGGGATAR